MRARAPPQPHSTHSSTYLEEISHHARGRREPTGRATAGCGANLEEEMGVYFQLHIFSYTVVQSR